MAIRKALNKDVTEVLLSAIKRMRGKKVAKTFGDDISAGVKGAEESAAKYAVNNNVPLVFDNGSFPELSRSVGLQHVPDLDYLHPTQILELPRENVVRSMSHNINRIADAFNDPDFIKLLDSGKFMDPEDALAFYWMSRADLQQAGQGVLTPETLAAGSGVMSPRTTPVDEVGEFGQILTDPANAYTGRLTYGNVDKSIDIIARQPDWTVGNDRNLIKKLSAPQTKDDAHWDTKVFNYITNQSRPSNARALTADTHALAIALGLPQYGAMGPNVFGNRKVYDLVREAYVNVAKQRGLLPQELQALTWSPWRQLVNGETDMRPMLGNIQLHPTVVQAAEGNAMPFLQQAKLGAARAKTRRVGNDPTVIDAAEKSYQNTISNLRQTAERAGLDPKMLSLMLMAGTAGGAGYGINQMRTGDHRQDALGRLVA
jgi:hypothetical protein